MTFFSSRATRVLARNLYHMYPFDNSTTTYESQDRKQTSRPLYTCCNNSRLAIACLSLRKTRAARRDFRLILQTRTIAKRNRVDGRRSTHLQFLLLLILLRKLLEHVATFICELRCRISSANSVETYTNIKSQFFITLLYLLKMHIWTQKKYLRQMKLI